MLDDYSTHEVEAPEIKELGAKITALYMKVVEANQYDEDIQRMFLTVFKVAGGAIALGIFIGASIRDLHLGLYTGKVLERAESKMTTEQLETHTAMMELIVEDLIPRVYSAE